MMIIWWSKHVGMILNVLVCDIWINVLLQTSALVGPLYITHYCVYVLCFVWTVFASDSQRVLSADTKRTTDSLAHNVGGATFLHIKGTICYCVLHDGRWARSVMAPHILNLDTRDQWSASRPHARPLPQVPTCNCSLIRSGRFGEEKNLLQSPGMESRIVQ
jgi:hypothetical protein